MKEWWEKKLQAERKKQNKKKRKKETNYQMKTSHKQIGEYTNETQNSNTKS